eukprot:5078775-Amphidinium_carterae.1
MGAKRIRRPESQKTQNILSLFTLVTLLSEDLFANVYIKGASCEGVDWPFQSAVHLSDSELDAELAQLLAKKRLRNSDLSHVVHPLQPIIGSESCSMHVHACSATQR